MRNTRKGRLKLSKPSLSAEKSAGKPEPGLTQGSAHAVLLACGNSLRQDDGVGLEIAEVAERMAGSRLRVVAVQQWTPELAEEIAGAELAIFVDASSEDEAGAIRVSQVFPPISAETGQEWGTPRAASETHSLEPAELLALAEQVCGHAPARAFAVTVGGESFHYGEGISGTVRQAVPRAARLVGNLVAAFASGSERAAA